MKKIILLLVAIAAIAATSGTPQRCPREADILIKGGILYDGTDKPAFKADIAIVADRIAYIGDIKPGRCKAAKVIDAQGCVVCPGFIDPHDHLESSLLKSRTNEPYLRMGVTTVIPGMCGGSQYPIKDFFEKLEAQGIGTNVASFTGHNTLRKAVMGSQNRFATDEEIRSMQEMLRKDIEDGSLGLSTGLFYVPGCFSEVREVVELARSMSDLGGIYTTHIRNENKDGIGLCNSITEALEIGRQAGVQVNISHIKCLGRSVWHLSDSVINIIERYQRDGLAVTADQYPYLASGTTVASALTPAWARDGGLKALRKRCKNPDTLALIKAEIPDMIYERGGAGTIYLSKNAGPYSKMTLAEAASQLGLDSTEAVIKLVCDYNPSLNTFVMCEEDLENFMKKPWVMSCTDGTYGSHPRAAGTYAELIQKYVSDRKTLSLGQFIRRSTGKVAETYHLKGRGFIETGCYADITIFRPEEVKANSTYQDPKALATGFKAVIVNGKIAVEDDTYTGVLAGRVLRKNLQ